MARANIPDGFADAIAADIASLFFAVHLVYDDETVYLWSGAEPLTIAGNEHIGAANVVKINVPAERNEVAASGIEIYINGVPNENIADALSGEYKGRPALLYLGTYNADGEPIIDLMFAGEMDTHTIVDGRETANIEISVQNRLVRLTRPAPDRYTQAQQHQRFPGDRSFEFINALQNQSRTIRWGAAGISVINPAIIEQQ